MRCQLPSLDCERSHRDSVACFKSPSYQARCQESCRGDLLIVDSAEATDDLVLDAVVRSVLAGGDFLRNYSVQELRCHISDLQVDDVALEPPPTFVEAGNFLIEHDLKGSLPF